MSVGAILAGVGAVAGAGASIYGASQAGEGAAAPATMSPKKSILSYIKGVSAGMPTLLETEGASRPEFGKLNLADQLQYLNGILGMGGTAATAGQQQLGAARDAEFADMRGNAGDVTGILGIINPEGRKALTQASTMADDAYLRSQRITPFEARQSDQQARAAFGARGRVNDNAAVAAEILGREDVMARKRQEAAMLGNNAFSLAGQFSNPALAMLSSSPASVALGQDYLANSRGIIGQNTPQLINPDAGINMGLQQASNLNAYNMANAASQQNAAAMWGQAGSSLMGLAGKIWENRD